jgi:hypothetical protein
VPLLGSPEQCRPPGGSPFHTEHVAVHGCLLLAEVHSVLLRHWELTAVDLALGLSDCSDWLLGQEGEVSGCSASGIGFLPVGCAGGTAATAERTAYGIAADAYAGSGADIPEGDST